jgi:hypothetical protein
MISVFIIPKQDLIQQELDTEINLVYKQVSYLILLA